MSVIVNSFSGRSVNGVHDRVTGVHGRVNRPQLLEMTVWESLPRQLPRPARPSQSPFGVDGELMLVKWKYYKTVLRYALGPPEEAIEHPYVTPQVPMIFNLSSDPHEDYNLWTTTLTMGWVFKPALGAVGAYERSVRRYPNIKPGEDFKGY